ncbi:MAG TPA: DUF1206 domain-containing protein [Gaiellaceae bacterium]
MATQQTPIELGRRGGAEVREKARSGTGWYAVLARVGLVAKGISFGIVGALAVKLAVGDGGKATSREGALKTLANHSFGEIALILIGIGFAAYALWRFVQAFAEREKPGAEGAVKTWGKRAGYVARGLIYAGLTYSTIKIVAGSGSGSGSQNERAHRTTATILGWPGGTWIAGIIGVAIVGAGLWNLYRGLSRKFEDRWRAGEMSARARKWGGRVGVVGHLARAVVFTLIGVFLVKAALDYTPRDAIGIDGALQKLSQASYGPWVLGLTAAGLVCYGLYCLVDARYRDVSAGSATG